MHFTSVRYSPTLIGSSFVLALWFTIVSCAATAHSEEWSIPVGGNAYRLSTEANERSGRNKETLSWGDGNSVYALYFHVDRSCDLKLLVEGRSEQGVAKLRFSFGDKAFTASLQGKEFSVSDIGDVSIDQPGYVRIDVQGKELAGSSFGEMKGLKVQSKTEGLKLTCVASNQGNMFYWGRRGPSVHLTYTVPKMLI